MRLAPGSGLAGPELLLDQADHPVVVAAATVDHAEAVALAVVEQVEVVADELHLEQRLVDGHRARRVHLLAQDQRAVPFHLDRDQAALPFWLVVVRVFVQVIHDAGPRPGDAVRGWRRLPVRRARQRRSGQHARRPHRHGVLDLAPVGGPAQPRLELGEGEVERGVPVVRGRLGPDRGTTGTYGQLDTLPAVSLPGVAFLGDLHVDPYRLLVKLLELG